MGKKMDKAVIMARGLGTRMRKADDHAALSAEQQKAAEKGLKLLIPVAGGTFIDYVMGALANAGYREICLIIGPEHLETREYFGKLKTSKINISFAEQPKPLGTANAVLAAEEFAAGDPFIVINSDNYYPPESLAALRDMDGPGLAGFEKQSMLAGSNIPADRIAKFAVIQIDGAGYMVKIIEKPAPEVLAAMPEPIYVSMNCWRFDKAIFEACRSITPSPRGEYEIPDAVTYSMEKLGRRYRVANIHAPVLDLSSRSDVEGVVAKMKGMEINL